MKRFSSRATASLLAFCCFWGALPSAMAGVFSVSPVRIYMTPRDRAVAVTLTNEGDTPIALQADINNWTQTAEGADQLTLTEELILSPPIIKLAPRSRQVVRLALLRPADPLRQLTYRMIVREVPEASGDGKNTIQVPIALALSLPVFVTPPAAQREVTCTLVAAPTPAPQVRCANAGAAYAQIRQMELKRGDAVVARFEGGSYILPGAAQTLTLKAEPAPAPGPAELSVSFDDGKTQVFSVVLP